MLVLALFDSIDAFNNTLGVHAAASVLVAYLRPSLLSLIYETLRCFVVEPRVANMSLQWFTRIHRLY